MHNKTQKQIFFQKKTNIIIIIFLVPRHFFHFFLFFHIKVKHYKHKIKCSVCLHNCRLHICASLYVCTCDLNDHYHEIHFFLCDCILIFFIYFIYFLLRLMRWRDDFDDSDHSFNHSAIKYNEPWRAHQKKTPNYSIYNRNLFIIGLGLLLSAIWEN